MAHPTAEAAAVCSAGMAALPADWLQRLWIVNLQIATVCSEQLPFTTCCSSVQVAIFCQQFPNALQVSLHWHGQEAKLSESPSGR